MGMKKNGMAETRKRRAAAKKGAKTRAENRAKAKADLKQSWAKAGVADGTQVKWKTKKVDVEKPPEVLGYGTVAVAGYGWENHPQSIRFCCENVKRENLGKVQAKDGNPRPPAAYCRCRNNPENYVIVQLVKEPGQ